MRPSRSWHRLRSLIHQSDLERGLDEEIRFHIDQQETKNLMAGMSPDDARRRALAQFGGVERIKEGTRDEFRPVLFQDSLQDVRHGVRALCRAPVFTLVVILTLALGIGATTAVFAVVHGVLIQPLPFPDADALVSFKHASVDNAGAPVGMAASMLFTYAGENRSFREVGLWSRGSRNVTGGVLPEEVTSLNVSVGTLPALGIPPARGRWFSPADHTPGSVDTVILTHGYWQRRFGGDMSVIGRQLTIDAQPHAVVGVMPASFRFLDETPDVILPLRFELAALTLGGFSYEGIARLAPGATVQRVIEPPPVFWLRFDPTAPFLR